MKFRFIGLGIWIAAGVALGYPEYPNENQSPGHLCTESDSHFTEYRYDEEIPYCKRRVSSGLKRSIYRAYGIPLSKKSNYTIDHIIPLSIGGSNRRANLWPEHREIKSLRPNLEYKVFLALQDGRIYQEEAIDIVLEAKFNPYEPLDPEWQRSLEPVDSRDQHCSVSI